MTRPLLLLDCDGVVADFVGHFLDTVRDLFGRHHAPETVMEWDIAAAIGLDERERARAYGEVLRDGWCSRIRPYPAAVDAVRALREAGVDVHVVTSPWPGHRTWHGEREEWLRHHFGLGPRDVTHTHRKAVVRGDALLDDKPEHVAAWGAAHPGGLALLWDQPYNVGADGPWRRVRTWGEVAVAVLADQLHGQPA